MFGILKFGYKDNIKDGERICLAQAEGKKAAVAGGV
jgi:hypothetical protein